MPKAAPPLQSLAMRFLRDAAGWSQEELAASLGMSASMLGHYETGRHRLKAGLLERAARAMGIPVEAVDVAVSAAECLRSSAEEMPSSPAYPSPGERQVVEQVAAMIASRVLSASRTSLLRKARARRVARAHAAAARQWAVLRGCTTAERRRLVERSVEYRSWALSVRLGEESERAARQSVPMTLELAGLALRAAELAEGSEEWRNRLAGRARGFVANALRVQGQLRAAEAEFEKACRLWEAGAAGDPDRVLPEWRLPDLEASLRRDLREFEAALALLDRAQAAAPSEIVGRILLKRALTLEQVGDVEGAVRELRQAAPLIRVAGEPHWQWSLDFNLGVNLCHLGRFAEAQVELPQLLLRSVELGNEVDVARVRWLSARVACGLGRRDEARKAFEEVRDQFAGMDDAYEAALASLDLAVLHLEVGDTAAVRDQARMMAWIFQSERLERESLASLRLFCKAALQERATLPEARRLSALMLRAVRFP